MERLKSINEKRQRICSASFLNGVNEKNEKKKAKNNSNRYYSDFGRFDWQWSGGRDICETEYGNEDPQNIGLL